MQGIPVWKSGTDFSSSSPTVGGFDGEWWDRCKRLSGCLGFVRDNPFFANDSQWMQRLNPGKLRVILFITLLSVDGYISHNLTEWSTQGTTCDVALQEWIDSAPKTQQDFNRYVREHNITYALPMKWSEVDDMGRRYRGFAAENPDRATAGVSNASVRSGAAEGWRRPEWDVEQVQQVRYPAGDGHVTETSATIRRKEAEQSKLLVRDARFKAATGTDLPVDIGSFVFVRRKAAVGTAVAGVFQQPLALALVYGVCNAEGAPKRCGKGATAANDRLDVQFFVSSGYENQYKPAVMTDADAICSALPKGTVHSGTVERGDVVMLNVITSRNKDGAGGERPAFFCC